MNKLMGFFELKRIELPTIPWDEYKPGKELSNDLLWTIRSAVCKGDDFNLPRLVGKKSDEAKKFANELYKKINKNGMVIYYPFFVAHKSGTLKISYDKIIVEAVKDDLWNLVTNQNIDLSLIYDINYDISLSFGEEFLSKSELNQLLHYSKKIRRLYRNDLLEKSILLEWSFASSCNIDKKPIGVPYLVFYEIRTIWNI